jgi:hypothetical protein
VSCQREGRTTRRLQDCPLLEADEAALLPENNAIEELDAEERSGRCEKSGQRRIFSRELGSPHGWLWATARPRDASQDRGRMACCRTRPNTRTGEVARQTVGRHSSAEFVAFLGAIVASQPRGKEIHVILDNLSAHKTPCVEQFLADHPNVQLHFAPTYSSWLNHVEI